MMIRGDLSVETGTYAMTIIPKNGKAVTDTRPVGMGLHRGA